MENYIQLNRNFSPVSINHDDEYQENWGLFLGSAEYLQWNDILKEFRCVILAEAGAGKTEELKQQALYLQTQNLPSFFIRIEDIDSDFENAFEVGSPEKFQQWLDNYDDAWFFLDSVDEARLTSPSAFNKAINKFANRIANAKHRAHIFISSRPYAWRPSEDRKIMDDKLYLPKTEESKNESDDDHSSLKILMLKPLDNKKIKQYCLARKTKNVDELLNEINRLSLLSLAERPFDLETIIKKWQDDKVLGSRLDLFSHNIKIKLTEQHSANKADRQTLTLEKSQQGARRLAASVILTGHAGILIPGTTNAKGICANEILSDWSSTDVRMLLELGIFNDIVYDTVRFRHREIRELLAAEWFDSLLKSGNDNNSIKALFFRELYGEKFIAPILRSVLSWLILFNNDFYQQAISIAPEIAVEGGDPAILSLPIREKLLEDIVKKIASDDDNGGSRDNSAIARIADPDLTQKVIFLTKLYIENDDAISFLGRLAWQGKMINSLDIFKIIVLNEQRGKYARIASLRAIATLGETNYCTDVWVSLNTIKENFQPQLFSELLEEIQPTIVNSKQLLISIEKLNFDQKNSDSRSVHISLTKFIEKLSVENDIDVLHYLLDGFLQLLNQEPFENKHRYKVSKKYAWLVSPTAQILDIIIECRCELVMRPNVLSFLIDLAQINNWRNTDHEEYKDKLKDLIPNWPELNDALYWASINKARSELKRKNKRLIDDWDAYWYNPFWSFDNTSYKRLLNNIPATTFEDDQLVALSTVIRLYQQTDKPPEILIALKVAVAGNLTLVARLQSNLGPRVHAQSDSKKKFELTQKKQHAKQLENEKERQGWIESLRANPEKITNNLEYESEHITNNIWWLFSEIEQINNNDGLITRRSIGAEWQKLIPLFGEAVAQEYRMAIQNVWRHHNVKLQSEYDEYSNSESIHLYIAMASLEVEFRETSNFPHHLSLSELKQTLRYLAKEINGLPNWLETLYKAFPEETLDAVKTELIWELEHIQANQQLHYILHDLCYYAPWIHKDLAPIVFNWLMSNQEKISEYPEYCIKIMLSGKLNLELLIDLIKKEIATEIPNTNKAHWFAFWVDCQADKAIPALKDWLKEIPNEEAKNSAETFINELIGERRDNRCISYYKTYMTPKYLKELYILVHKYVKSAEDIEIDRTNGGVYRSGLRLYAQRARNQLFSLLSELSGKEAYVAIKDLERVHPVPTYRPWMAKRAFKIAESDGDIEPWNSEQVLQFEHQQLITPRTHQQLYELGVLQLNNLKAWIEKGNDSPWKTWQRVVQENELRNLIAGWLNQNCRDQYTTAQEPELANSQRMDIWLHSNHVNAPVPIEIKLLDKGWSGNQLCERLRNQLVGDYIRDNGASCGIMLLVSANTHKTWKIDGQSIPLHQLSEKLTNYWNSIANNYSDVNAIEIIVIDINLRSKFSDT